MRWFCIQYLSKMKYFLFMKFKLRAIIEKIEILGLPLVSKLFVW